MKIVAIDPSLNGSGVAIWSDGEFETLCRMDLWEIFEFMDSEKVDYYMIENSNMTKANWHGATGRANVGKNQAVSKLLVDYAIKKGINFIELKPSGYSMMYADSKGNYSDYHKRLFLADTKYLKSTNKDSRAAAAMILANKHIVKELINKNT